MSKVSVRLTRDNRNIRKRAGDVVQVTPREAVLMKHVGMAEDVPRAAALQRTATAAIPPGEGATGPNEPQVPARRRNYQRRDLQAEP